MIFNHYNYRPDNKNTEHIQRTRQVCTCIFEINKLKERWFLAHGVFCSCNTLFCGVYRLVFLFFVIFFIFFGGGFRQNTQARETDICQFFNEHRKWEKESPCFIIQLEFFFAKNKNISFLILFTALFQQVELAF